MSNTVSKSNLPLGPAALYKHDHPPVKNAHQDFHDRLTFGQRVADRVASTLGGWPFIILQSLLLVAWMAANVYLYHHWKDKAFDPYPFILLNLVLSFQAAYTGPIVMMSQNRQNEKDRYAAQCDFECNQKAEEEIRVLMEHLAHQDLILADIVSRLDALPGKPAATSSRT
ncbi:MAG TPA: DUF1003 domain-containing protein [Chthonomonadaceae bacterium]|nr:DUF1003 domain-containing protein [Chthonomonadaceae bacterium]